MEQSRSPRRHVTTLSVVGAVLILTGLAYYLRPPTKPTPQIPLPQTPLSKNPFSQTPPAPVVASPAIDLDPGMFLEIERRIAAELLTQQQENLERRDLHQDRLDKAIDAHIRSLPDYMLPEGMSRFGGSTWMASLQRYEVETQEAKDELIRLNRVSLARAEEDLLQQTLIDVIGAVEFKDGLAVGDFGWMRARANISKINDDGSVLVELPGVLATVLMLKDGRRVLRSAQSPLPQFIGKPNIDAVLRGFDLGLVPNQVLLILDEGVTVTGTTAITTETGETRTAFIIEPLDLQPYIDAALESTKPAAPVKP